MLAAAARAATDMFATKPRTAYTHGTYTLPAAVARLAANARNYCTAPCGANTRPQLLPITVITQRKHAPAAIIASCYSQRAPLAVNVRTQTAYNTAATNITHHSSARQVAGGSERLLQAVDCLQPRRSRLLFARRSCSQQLKLRMLARIFSHRRSAIAPAIPPST
jgi:hypothetical protein